MLNFFETNGSDSTLCLIYPSFALVVFSILFILLDDSDWQGVVLNLMKIGRILVFSAVWVLFPRFLGRLSGDLC